MGLLDELKKEAEAVQQERNREVDASQAKHELIENELRPRMRELYSYFKELRDQLEVLDPDIHIDCEVEGMGTLRGLRQGKYRIATDDPQALDSFTFHYACEKPGRVEIRKPDRGAVERQREFLWSQNLRFQVRDSQKDGSGLFLLDAFVPVSIEFSIDAERGGIALRLRNVHGLGVMRHLFSADRLDKDFTEELAKVVLGKPNRFNELTGNVLPDEFRTQLRQQVEREKAGQRCGTGRATAPAPAAPPAERKGIAGRFGRTFLGRGR